MNTTPQIMTDDEFRAYVLSILEKELGKEGVGRFLHLVRFGIGQGDYTRDRHQWQKDLTVAQIAAEMGIE